MSKKINTKLSSGKKTLKEGKNVKLGPCIFPFKFKGEEYNKCFAGKDGDWCATEVDSNSKMKKYAFCDYEETPKKQRKFQFKKKFDVSTLPKELQIPTHSSVTPDVWELPNRQNFPNWVFDTYKTYIAKKGAVKFKKGEKFDFFSHQKFVRDYLQVDSPYRGLLLFHGLGVGKTCASIGIAEGFRDSREVVVLLNKSLAKNYVVNLMKCGFEYFRVNQHWVFKNVTTDKQLKDYAKFLKISDKLIKKHGGAFFVDFDKAPNYEELSASDQNMLMAQIDEMIHKKYSFLHLDGLNEKKLLKLNEERVLDNKLLVIDEVHNLSNAMAKASPGIRGKHLKTLIMEAKNLKCVFLSGTPMINNLFEAGQLFNLLRGYISMYTFLLKPKASSISIPELEKVLQTHPKVDQYFVNKKDFKIRLTFVPQGYINDPSGKGVVKSDDNMSDNEIIAEITKSVFESNGYNVSVVPERYTAFPNDETEFMNLFYDSGRNKIKNPKLFQSRIIGLVSYYKTQNKELLPTVTKNEVLELPMSDYQFLKYSNVRKQEIDQDKNKKKRDKPKGDSEELFSDKSSYRAYSRMHCSFAFPEDIPRPTPKDAAQKLVESSKKKKGTDEELKQIEELGSAEQYEDLVDDNDESPESASSKQIVKEYERQKNLALRRLNRMKETYLVSDADNKLSKYSPKYNAIVAKISEVNGTAFVYTEYRTLEGIATLEIVLKANGYAPFLLQKTGDDDFKQVYENDGDKDKPMYALWGGDEQTSDIIRKVYNNDFEELPKTLKTQLESSGKTNLRGDIIKVLMTTKTGAEGIDLHNVRQVHVIEPFWNPVRVKQVKGRAVRVGSHIQLPPKDRTVEIYTYLAKITKEQLKSDKQIGTDSDGMSSDQVLFEISNRKLEVMEDFLRLIKEVSVDCSLNLEETTDETERLKCFGYGANAKRENYSYIPNINEEYGDFEKQRRVKVTTWKPVLIKVNIKGKNIEFAVKKAPQGKENLLYNSKNYKLGVLGEPIGHYVETEDGKKKFTFYKKAQGQRLRKLKTKKK